MPPSGCSFVSGRGPLIAGVLSLRGLNYCSPDDFDDLRDDRVPEASQTVHPSGNPMSHSTHVGFNCPPIATAWPSVSATAQPNLFGFVRPSPEQRRSTELAALPAFGVGHIAGTLPCLSRTSRPAIALASSSVQSPSSHRCRASRTVPSHGIPDADGVGYIFAAIASTKLPLLPLRRNRSAISGVGSQPMHLSAVGVGHIRTQRSSETVLFVSKFNASDDVDFRSM